MTAFEAIDKPAPRSLPVEPFDLPASFSLEGASWDATARLWNVVNGELLAEARRPHDRSLRGGILSGRKAQRHDQLGRDRSGGLETSGTDLTDA